MKQRLDVLQKLVPVDKVFKNSMVFFFIVT